VDMPFGPERLTIRLTLMDEHELDPRFFEHAAHHAADRTVELEN